MTYKQKAINDTWFEYDTNFIDDDGDKEVTIDGHDYDLQTIIKFVEFIKGE